MQGGERYIMHLADAAPSVLKAVPAFTDAIANVKSYRSGKIPAKGKAPDKIKQPGQSSLQLAETPRKYHVTVVPDEPFLIVPEVSSERRQYIPIAWQEPPTIPSNLVKVMKGADKVTFALLTSAMHMAWMRTVSGRLESRYRYAIGLVYNTFPLPAKLPSKSKIEALVDAVLKARKAHSDETLADLYDPELMPDDLQQAHSALDRSVDRLYRPGGFKSERERVEYLFQMYEKMAAPIVASSMTKKKHRKK